MRASTWPAPAKINLFLHITGRREDGYHLLQTVFQFLDYGDELTFSLREDGRIERPSSLAGVAAEEDLVVRAARLLKKSSGCPLGADIRVDKRLPMGGGLGGGSSNAATTLVALNHLWGLGLSEEHLAALGLELGADVPVFVRGRAAWAEGVGEQLTPVELPEPWFVVIVPPASVSTAELFGAPELTRDCAPITIADFLSGAGSNVFEPVVRSRYSAVAEALDWLTNHGPARLTGSGGCIFAPFSDQQQAREVLAVLPEGWRGFVAQGRNRSPLLAHLALQG
ncbi:4-(cytidine 5'-diphospho)-2-C-methyl-D-erythritol kinase [Thiohalomonas denitrificans]|uniref:4-diphosphocytidyl-2-C-methyl-D-erythritol kinase n=1 Tax=Thiohalomonas denitrificans TaxID=415747 RepID=A0A1G5Q8W2_9GAMM|nr:4-(cytidine 5'-diphospho)-2-C-methyl-D-erythritol kinase [Thiohalomonas denitrificans]SCZ57910.1 4-diphosphocytidyl-2-C-methyl-D-erythritol kinase [Thiohalomonas denitrificans]